MKACLKGKRKAQYEFYARFAAMMKGICLRYASSEMEAEDVLQESFITAFDVLKQWNSSGPLGAWLRKITINKSLEQYRKNHSKKGMTVIYNMNEKHPEISDDAIEQLELESLLAKIQSLPEGFRAVFNLYAIEGFNHREIGDLLDISEGTSKSQYSRARVLLRKMIEVEEGNVVDFPQMTKKNG